MRHRGPRGVGGDGRTEESESGRPVESSLDWAGRLMHQPVVGHFLQYMSAAVAPTTDEDAPAPSASSRRRLRLAHSVHGACNFAENYAGGDSSRSFRSDGVSAGLPIAPQRKEKKDETVSPRSSGNTSGACFICFESDGPLLVNVCACSWSCVHPACLERLLAPCVSAAVEAGEKPKPVCRVCKTAYAYDIKPPLVVEKPPDPLALRLQGGDAVAALDMLWRNFPSLMLTHILGMVTIIVIGVTLAVRSTEDKVYAAPAKNIEDDATMKPVMRGYPNMDIGLLFMGVFLVFFGVAMQRISLFVDGEPDGAAVRRLANATRAALCCPLTRGVRVSHTAPAPAPVAAPPIAEEDETDEEQQQQSGSEQEQRHQEAWGGEMLA